MYKYLFETLLSILLGKCAEIQLLDCMVILFVVFLGTTVLFSTVAIPLYTFTRSTQEFQFLNILAKTCLFTVLFLNGSRPNGCEVVSHNFGLHFPNDKAERRKFDAFELWC